MGGEVQQNEVSLLEQALLISAKAHAEAGMKILTNDESFDASTACAHAGAAESYIRGLNALRSNSWL